MLALVPAVLGLVAGFHRDVVIVPIELIAIALMMVIGRVGLPIVDRWTRGAVGEEEVGKIIDGMRAQGWRAIHDVATGSGNVDHILVGPAGVFTIETKSRRGAIDPAKIASAMLKQAYAESKFVERITGIKVEPLLVFSRAYLIGRGVNRRAGVTVLAARMLAGHLARRPIRLTAGRVTEVHALLTAALETE